MHRLTPAIPFHRVANVSNNATLVVGRPARLYSIWVTNVTATILFLKFFDTQVTPNPLTDQPVFVCGVPGVLLAGATSGAGGALSLPRGIRFENGLGLAMVTGAADGNNTSIVAAGDLVASITYRAFRS